MKYGVLFYLFFEFIKGRKLVENLLKKFLDKYFVLRHIFWGVYWGGEHEENSSTDFILWQNFLFFSLPSEQTIFSLFLFFLSLSFPMWLSLLFSFSRSLLHMQLFAHYHIFPPTLIMQQTFPSILLPSLPCSCHLACILFPAFSPLYLADSAFLSCGWMVMVAWPKPLCALSPMDQGGKPGNRALMEFFLVWSGWFKVQFTVRSTWFRGQWVMWSYVVGFGLGLGWARVGLG